MEEVVLSNQEDTGQLLVVVGHHYVLWWTLAEVEQGMDILNASESLLPQLKLDCDIQLLETSLEMALKGIWVIKVDSVHLSGVLCCSLNMISEELAQSAELGLSCVLLAELESLHSGALVHNLQSRIVPEDIQNRPVGLPEELEPWCNDSSICAISRLFAGNGGEEDGFGRFAGFKIIYTGRRVGRLERRLYFVGLSLCSLHFFLCQLDKLLQNQLFPLYQHCDPAPNLMEPFSPRLCQHLCSD